MAISRGEIYFVELGPTKGYELDRKKCPVVVISINDINAKPLVVTVIPGKTYFPGQRVFPTEVKVEPAQDNGLSQPTIFQCFQIKALDHSRFDNVSVGTIAAADLQRLEHTLKLCLGLP